MQRGAAGERLEALQGAQVERRQLEAEMRARAAADADAAAEVYALLPLSPPSFSSLPSLFPISC